MQEYTGQIERKARELMMLYNEHPTIPIDDFEVEKYDRPGEENLGFGKRTLAVNIGNKIINQDFLTYAIIHELGHNFHDSVNPDYTNEIINNYSSTKVLGMIMRLLTQSLKKSFWTVNCIDALIEGVADYFALNIFPETTGFNSAELIRQRKRHQSYRSEGIQAPISAGYNFFLNKGFEETINFIKKPKKIKYYEIG